MTTDIYYSSSFKKDYENYYDFNIPLDINIDVKDDEKLFLKLIDFSMMNSMLTISNAHKNNKFSFVYDEFDIQVIIPDGSYTATSLRDWINAKFLELNAPLSLNYDKTKNKFYFIISDDINELDLIFYPEGCKLLFGLTNVSYIWAKNNTYYADTFANMLPYSKIIVSTNLAFVCSSQNNFISDYSSNSGMGDILCWINRDIPLFTTINYINNQGLEIEISNKNLKFINILIMNEYKEFILDCPSSFIHLQLIIKKNLIE